MTYREIIYDILEIKKAITDDTDIEEMWILHKFFNYRELIISMRYTQTNLIDHSWVQRHPRINVEKVTAADDPSVIYSSIPIGKAKIPKVVSLPDNLGYYRLSGASGINNLEPCDFGTMMLKAYVGDKPAPGSGYFSVTSDAIYLWPYIPYISAMLIAANPLEMPYNDNGTIRDATLDDECPVDRNTAQMAILEFLSKDLGVRDKTVADFLNDSQDSMKVMRGYNGYDQSD